MLNLLTVVIIISPESVNLDFSEQADGNYSDDTRAWGRQTDERFLQQDGIAQIKTSDMEENCKLKKQI